MLTFLNVCHVMAYGLNIRHVCDMIYVTTISLNYCYNSGILIIILIIMDSDWIASVQYC